jgi:hypothetical protein
VAQGGLHALVVLIDDLHRLCPEILCLQILDRSRHVVAGHNHQTENLPASLRLGGIPGTLGGVVTTLLPPTPSVIHHSFARSDEAAVACAHLQYTWRDGDFLLCDAVTVADMLDAWML